MRYNWYCHYNHSMNAQVLSRITQIKHYINTLSGSLASKENTQASAVISKFKQSMIKSDPDQQTNQFVLDCLKAKNEKLKQELYDIQSQKKGIEGKLKGLKDNKKQIKSCKIEIYITRLTISLNQSRKVEYEEAFIHSDYQKIYVNSVLGSKYQNYSIQIQEIQQVQLKLNLLYICVIGEKTFHIIVKFKNEKEAQKWNFCLKYGQMIAKYKKKDRLFEEKRQESTNNTSTINTNISPPPLIPNFSVTQSVVNPPLRNSVVRNSLTIPQVPFLSFQGQNKTNSPTESMVSEKKNYDKSFDKQVEKMAPQKSQRSLIIVLNNEAIRSSGTFNIRQPIQQSYSKRIDMNRPPTLTRVRGNSNHTEKGASGNIQAYRASGIRKQSEDIIKPHINQVYHEKMLQKYRSQQQDLEDMKSSQVTPLQIPLAHQFDNEQQIPPQKTAKIKMLEQKKKQLLKQSNILPADKPAFLFDNKVSWMGIEEMDDQNKSKSSNRMSVKSKKGSQFSDSGFMASSDNVKKETRQDDQSEHITQKSQEQSPKLPRKSPSYDVPHKISYANGIIFQLHKVQKTGVSSPLIPTKEDATGERNNTFGSQTSSSDYSDDDHSDPSSHQNHTQSQDNNARSQQLKKGIILTKCSQNGFWTHQKIVYLSQNQNQLCCRDLKDKKIKKIRLENIKEVEYKQFDKGIIKHIPKIEEDKCFVIRALDDDNKIKNFEFVGNLAEPLERFATNLKLFVEYYNQL